MFSRTESFNFTIRTEFHWVSTRRDLLEKFHSIRERAPEKRYSGIRESQLHVFAI